MKVLITGSNGFIAKNLRARFHELGNFEVTAFSRQNSLQDLSEFLLEAEAIVHLAGINRPSDEDEFKINVDLTHFICETLINLDRKIPIIFSSSIQAELDNNYGISKRKAEDILISYANKTGAFVYIYRLPNVFGKWSKPDYNSVVATFCYKISRDLPIKINDNQALLKLIYIDDVTDCFIEVLKNLPKVNGFSSTPLEYGCSVGELAKIIQSFRESRDTLLIDNVGNGFLRALYATYVSFLPPDSFVYDVPCYTDTRGVFVEMLKTKDSGQISCFTARVGVTRGGHYHHTKTEKFLVIKGQARFRFRHILTNEKYEIFTSDKNLQIVETVPGWWHDITNIGENEMIVLLWANEVFDRKNPDTFSLSEVSY